MSDRRQGDWMERRQRRRALIQDLCWLVAVAALVAAMALLVSCGTARPSAAHVVVHYTMAACPVCDDPSYTGKAAAANEAAAPQAVPPSICGHPRATSLRVEVNAPPGAAPEPRAPEPRGVNWPAWAILGVVVLAVAVLAWRQGWIHRMLGRGGVEGTPREVAPRGAPADRSGLAADEPTG